MSDDQRFSRLENKLDKLSEKLSSIDKTLVAQHESLKEHIRRTELLEKDMEPIKKHVIMIQGGVKFLAILGTGVGIIGGIIKFWR